MPNLKWSKFQSGPLSLASWTLEAIEIKAITWWNSTSSEKYWNSRFLQKFSGRNGRRRGGGRVDPGGDNNFIKKRLQIVSWSRMLECYAGLGPAERAVFQQWKESPCSQCLLEVFTHLLQKIWLLPHFALPMIWHLSIDRFQGQQCQWPLMTIWPWPCFRQVRSSGSVPPEKLSWKHRAHLQSQGLTFKNNEWEKWWDCWFGGTKNLLKWKCS